METFKPQILIIEFGGQLTQKIGSVVRNSSNVRPVIMKPQEAEEWLSRHMVKGIILSGSGKSVNDADAPAPPDTIFRLQHAGRHVPILGICYGMQYLAKYFGGEVSSGVGEYGDSHIEIIGAESLLFDNTPRQQKVWMSHGDSVKVVGHGFEPIGFSPGCVAAMADRQRDIYGVQFHPESDDTEFGETIITNFVRGICGCKADWVPSSVIDGIRAESENIVQGGRVSFPFSGGVDSTVSALILSEVFANRLSGYTLDADQLRLNETAEIELHAQLAHMSWKLIDAREEFVAAVSRSIAGPVKRQIFGSHYNDHLNREALAVAGTTHVVQGTLAPDLIESGKTGGSEIVKHHNTGLVLPSGVSLLEPLRLLYKYEVREIGRSLGLPGSVFSRQPFPGPGLLIRVVGVPVTHELLELVRWADDLVRQITKKHGDYDRASQIVTAFLALITSGVKGDVAHHAGSIGIRGLHTNDFMTGRGVYFSEATVRECSSVLPQNAQVQRVWWDSTDKPPARTEFE